MSIGLLLTALGLGLRHGIDWDHIAAIADLTSSTDSRRRGFHLSMIYALGHGVVVFGLGAIAIAFGAAIPESADAAMGRIVGLTLVALGAWILIGLIRKGRGFRLRSRWMLILDGTFAGLRRVRRSSFGRHISIEHEHRHEHDDPPHDAPFAHDHAHIDASAERVLATIDSGTRSARPIRIGSASHTHGHRHDLVLPDSGTGRYAKGTAAGIGMLHGVGIESPTQIAIFVASTSIGGIGFGLVLLAAWVIGLVVANAGLAAAAGSGFLQAENSFTVYAVLAVVIAVLSITTGILYLIGLDLLPALN